MPLDDYPARGFPEVRNDEFLMNLPPRPLLLMMTILGIGVWTQIMSLWENVFYHHRVTSRQNANSKFSSIFEALDRSSSQFCALRGSKIEIGLAGLRALTVVF